MENYLDLSRILYPISLETFFNDYWEKGPLIIERKDNNYYKDLLTMSDVDNIITSTDLKFPEIRLAKYGTKIPSQEYTNTIRIAGVEVSGVASVDKILIEYQKGATIILQALDRRWKPLTEFCRDLESILGCRFQTNIYLTPKHSQGFAPHYDTHDVFVLQAAGKKHWKIYNSPFSLPLRSQPYDSSKTRASQLLTEIDLETGDLIYIPRGFIHEATASEETSLHITLGLITYTWADVMSEALLYLCETDVRFRKSLPVDFFQGNNLNKLPADEFKDLLSAFSDKLPLGNFGSAIREKFLATRLQSLERQLIEIEGLDNLTLQSEFRKRPKIIFELTEDASSVCLLFHGKKLQFPNFAESALRYIADNDSCAIESIADNLDDKGKITLVRRLIREGFLVSTS